MNRRLLAGLLAVATTAAVAQGEAPITYRSKELGFAVTLATERTTSIAVFDHGLIAARRESGDKPAEPRALHLFNVKQGQFGSAPLGFACSAILGTPGAGALMALQRSQVESAAAGLSEVQQVAVNGLRGYALEYEVAGIGSAFFAFDSEPWAVVCGGSYSRETSAVFKQVFQTLGELQ